METNWNCPVCKMPLHQQPKKYVCENGHQFDRARQGYVNLSRKQKPSGDSPESIKARTAFLEQGYYQFLKDRLIHLIGQYEPAGPAVLIDLGCGQGWYTRDLPAHTRFGIDLAKEAIRHAAGQDKKTSYAVGSIFSVPLSDGCADVITSIFTPIPEKEVARLLKPGGTFIQVSPAADHLKELKQQLYETITENELPKMNIDGLECIDQQIIKETKTVSDVWDLFEMTPYRYRSSKEGMEKVKALESLDVTFSFVLTVFRKA